jgi:hypothetical protein
MGMPKGQKPHPDDFILIQIGLEFRAKENPANAEPWPLSGPTGFDEWLPANEKTAEWLDDEIAKAGTSALWLHGAVLRGNSG